MTFTPLILAGGKSTRMRSPKHLLPMPDGRPLYQHLIDHLHNVCPNAPTIYISLALDSERDDFLRDQPTVIAPTNVKSAERNNDSNHPNLSFPPPTSPSLQQQAHHSQPRIEIILDRAPSTPSPPPTASPPTETQAQTRRHSPPPHPPPPPPSHPSRTSSSGPATGLLSAHAFLPKTTFLVVACDHPLLTAPLLHRLCARYTPPVTCFRNREGFAEPLVAVWGPEALGVLQERVEEAAVEGKGRGVGPARVVREVRGLVLDVGAVEGEEVGRGLEGVNTPEEWEAAVRVLKGRLGGNE